jgi:hypothetical protein
MKRGRPKGYSPYIEISYEELADYVGKKTPVKVCKNWIEDLVRQANSTTKMSSVNALTEESSHEPELVKDLPKIEFELTNFNE